MDTTIATFGYANKMIYLDDDNSHACVNMSELLCESFFHSVEFFPISEIYFYLFGVISHVIKFFDVNFYKKLILFLETFK